MNVIIACEYKNNYNHGCVDLCSARFVSYTCKSRNNLGLMKLTLSKLSL